MSGGFPTVRSVGAMIPSDLLDRIIAGDPELGGLTPTDYHLGAGETPREAANRAWSYLTGVWATYRSALEGRGDGASAAGLTREKWLLLLFRELGYGRVAATPPGGLQAGSRSFPVSHLWERVPLHLLGWGVSLDRRSKGVAGAAERAPQAMVQELLNRSDDYLWAVVTNGQVLRLLRDSTSLSGQAYLEFDLEAMFDGEVFSDFALLFLLLHQSRVETLTQEGSAADCWLERWRTNAVETGARALGSLRDGVKIAIEALGTGFLQHPANNRLREGLDSGTLQLNDLHRALLRLVYRLLFLFVAEDRDALLHPDTEATARARYHEFFSTARLRRLSLARRGTKHTDLWQSLTLVIGALGQDEGLSELGLPGLGGLFDNGPLDILATYGLPNDALLTAIRRLSIVQPRGELRRTVDYRNLGAEELGGIYESLLELVPRYDVEQRSFTLETLAGNERKTSGSYYTPSELIDLVLDEALDPLLDDAEKSDAPVEALLSLTCCDPAVGSGHFLVAAARRIALRLAAARSEELDPTPADMQGAMHDVVANCIYGVDVNPLAAELAKVSLWLEALQPGRPLTFLDAHIKVGNALLGTTPALLAGGIPDDAFNPIEGDDKKAATGLKKRNKAERDTPDQGELFGAAAVDPSNTKLRKRLAEITEASVDSLEDAHLAQRRYADYEASPVLRHARLIADAWCAAFVQPKVAGAPAITQAVLRRVADLNEPLTDGGDSPDVRAAREIVEVIESASRRYRFFHWHLEFPNIFVVPQGGVATATGWTGGFSCVIGNPPWERVKLQEREFFEARDQRIAQAPTAAARRRLIAALVETNPALMAEFSTAKRQAEGESHFLRTSGRYPLCGRGDINTYAVFAETNTSLLAVQGRSGAVLPTGIATDATTQLFFGHVVNSRQLAALLGFYDRKQIFTSADVHGFCVLVLAGSSQPQAAGRFCFFVRSLADLSAPGVQYYLTPADIQLLNPNTATCPVFGGQRDADITLGIYRRLPVLVRSGDVDGNRWNVTLTTMFHMSNDSHLFEVRPDLEADGWSLNGNMFVRDGEQRVPLYEAKMVHHFNHRWATYDDSVVRDTTAPERSDPRYQVLPRYWVDPQQVNTKLAERWSHDWMIGWRDICRSTDERTTIATIFPRAGVGNKLPLMLSPRDPKLLVALVSCLSSFALDFASRQKVGGTTMNFFIFEQLPVPAPPVFTAPAPWDSGKTVCEWLVERAIELEYTSYDLRGLALDLGDGLGPFQWDDERRSLLRAEVDAAHFHIFGLSREDTDYIMGTFPVVRQRDEAVHGDYRTKRLVLERFDALLAAIDSGQPYNSPLDPAPGFGRRHPEGMP